MKYTITIEKAGSRIGVMPKTWQMLGQDADGKKNMGYTPEVEATIAYDEKIYEQIVEDLDLAAVIKAVNKLE